jgi:hypothetical protein
LTLPACYFHLFYDFSRALFLKIWFTIDDVILPYPADSNVTERAFLYSRFTGTLRGIWHTSRLFLPSAHRISSGSHLFGTQMAYFEGMQLIVVDV